MSKLVLYTLTLVSFTIPIIYLTNTKTDDALSFISKIKNKIQIPQAHVSHHDHDSVQFPKSSLMTFIDRTSNAKTSFRNHPLHIHKDIELENSMQFLAKLPQCKFKPVFLSIARISSPLYWQLVENFFHTMFRFSHLDCAILVCISGKLRQYGSVCHSYVFFLFPVDVKSHSIHNFVFCLQIQSACVDVLTRTFLV